MEVEIAVCWVLAVDSTWYVADDEVTMDKPKIKRVGPPAVSDADYNLRCRFAIETWTSVKAPVWEQCTELEMMLLAAEDESCRCWFNWHERTMAKIAHARSLLHARKTGPKPKSPASKQVGKE